MDQLPTLVAALVGAVAGGIGAEWLRHRLQGRAAAEQAKQEVAQRHLILLQDAIESLYFRLANLSEVGGTTSSDYYQLSSVYALGNLLAHKRRLMLDGVYAQLGVYGAGFPAELERRLEGVEATLGREGNDGVSFYRYQRQALGEYQLAWDGGWRALTYAEFLGKRHDGSFQEIIAPALAFLSRLDSARIPEVRHQLGEALDLVAEKTGIPAGAGRKGVTGIG